MWKESEITAQFALCQRCTNCTQQSFTTDFTTDLTVWEGVDVRTKRWIILQHTDCLRTEMLGVGYQTVGRDSGLLEGI